MRRGLAVIGTALAQWAAAATPVPPQIEDPNCLGINKLPAHATLMPYPTVREALAANRRTSSFARDLNGLWKFHWVPKPEQRPADFWKAEFDASKWSDLAVPACWQVHGYGTPYYRNAGYTFRIDPPQVMSEPPRDWPAYDERNSVGSYRREFEVPREWTGRRIFITFDGVDSAFFIWVNGKPVGYSVNSKNAAEFDLTDVVKPGKGNVLAVEVWRYCAGSYLEDQDKWRLSGITRNVTLWSAAPVRLRDLRVRTDLAGDFQSASLVVTGSVRNDGAVAAKPGRMTVALHGGSGKPLGGEAEVPALAQGEEREVTVTVPVRNPKLWTAETPDLYTTVVGLESDGKAADLVSVRTGFRAIRIDGRRFLVNGRAIKLKGANRHEHWADTGHVVSEERMIRDIEVLKRGNCNHVRTAHYSNDPRWYELCDEHGLYLVAEANVECHGLYGKLDRDPAFESAIVDRNRTNVMNFANHASVIMWSLGNENGGGSSFLSALKAVREADPSRPVHYECFGIGKDNPADVDSRMYTHPDEVGRIALDGSLTKPFYLCEYAHAMNNSMGAIAEYNDIIDSHESLLGGAIWEWQDQGLWNRRDPGRPFLAYGGGFGDLPNDGYFIHKGVVWHDRTPKPHYPEMTRAYQWIGIKPANAAGTRVTITNRYAFTDIAPGRFKAIWGLAEDGVRMAGGPLRIPVIAPGRSADISVPAKFTPKAGREYFIRISFALAKAERWASRGHEVAAAQVPVGGGTPAPAIAVPASAKLDLREDGDLIRVAGKGFEIRFSRSAGTIAGITVGKTELIRDGGGPRPHLWRAPHRNDDDWADRGWRRAGLKSLAWRTLDLHAVRLANGAVRVESSAFGEGRGGFGVNHAAVWTIFGDGMLVCDHAISPRGRRITLARMGIRMFLDPKFADFEYFGRGPFENYADRKRGSDLGRYASTVAGQLTPYPKPMECGNHEDVRWLTLGAKAGPALLVTSPEQPVQVSALPYSDEELEPPPYDRDLPPSRSTVLIVSAKTLGVGSASCGPRPLEACVVRSDPARFAFALRLLPKAPADPAAAARIALPDRPLPPLADPDSAGERAEAVPFTVTKSGHPPLGGVFAYPKQVGGWKIVRASSFQPGEGEPEHALDGDPESFWHSRWSPDAPPHPHELVIDLGAGATLKGLRYKGREWMTNGRVKDYEIFVSEHPDRRGTAAAKGTLDNHDGWQEIRFARSVSGRYLTFVALSEVGGKPYASIAELEPLP